MQSKTAHGKSVQAGTWIAFLLIMCFLIPTRLFAAEFTATSLADYGNVSVMEVSGVYDAKNPDGTVNSAPRQAIATEFFRTHKDEYDFLVVFTNFDFAMPDDGKARGFFEGVKNDTQGIGSNLFDNTSFYGSSGRLQGTIDMGNLAKLVSDPMDPKFNETLYILSHEMMHRWGSYAKFKDAEGSDSTALLGKDQAHWSFLLDSGGSVLYGNRWQNNGNGTFTSLAPKNELKFYSPLDLYLMGMIDKSKVPPMLLIDSPGTDPKRLPEAGVTIAGTARTVTIDDIIAAMGPRDPDASTSQKSFKTAFIYITQPGTFTADSIYAIENIRNGLVTRHSILTDGKSIVQVAPTTKDDIPMNPGILPPSTTPRTSPANISEGVQWLKTNQKSDGSWTDLPQTEERDTAQAVLVLKNFLDAQANYGSGLQRLGLSTSGNTDFLCRKIEAFAAAQQNTTDLIAELLARRNRDGGWGSDRMYQSNPADTGLALKALAMAGYGDQSVIAPAISYLITRQNSSDGGWGPDDNGSTLQFTAAVLSAFNKYRGSYQLEDPISRGMTLIASRQNKDTDKGFGNSPSTVYDTATAVLVLRELGASTDITNDGLDYIRGRQGDDGSWNGSAFQTAMAIDAVYKGTVDPDLSIKTADITFIPTTISSLPANIVISANIWNLGQTAVPEAVVALYKDSVTAPNRITEQVVAFPGQQATTVTFSTGISSGNEHRFFLVVDPANLVNESSKANNSAAAVITAEATYDLEVLSQDITLSANPVDMFQDVTITSKITNKGTMNAYNAQVKYFIDDPANPFVIATSTIDVPAGATATDSVTWRTNKAGVNMPLTVQAYINNNYTELSETNNKASTTITVNADTRPNITVSFKDIVATPSPAKQGGSVSISALVKNEGFSAANEVNVNIWSAVTGTIGMQTIAALAPGESKQVVVDWTNIPVSGDQIIYVRTDYAGPEIRKDDNDAFIILNILNLPDLAISTNSITFSPAFPKDSDTVTIVATIKNEGEQSAQDVVVNAFEGSTLIGTRTITAIPGRMTTSATFTYNTAGRQGTHEITVIVDPENLVTEQNKTNNRASHSIGVQNANLGVTEAYFSPNGDGVKDTTQLFFRQETAQALTVMVMNNKSETVRTFRNRVFDNSADSSITWDGSDDNGKVVADGRYQLRVMSASNAVLGSVSVTVDTNHSPLTDALGTTYLLNTNLTCTLPDIDAWEWFSDETGIAFSINTDSTTAEYPAGLYSMSPDGTDIQRLVPYDWSTYTVYTPQLSPNGERMAFLVYDNYNSLGVWGVDRDGTNLTQIVSLGASSSYAASFQWSPDSKFIVYTVSGSSGGELWSVNLDTNAKTLLDTTSNYFGLSDWSPAGDRFAYTAYVQGSAALRVSSISGNFITVMQMSSPDDCEWLTDDVMACVDGEKNYGSWTRHDTLWLADMNGGENHKKVYDYDFDMENGEALTYFISPDRRSIAFRMFSAKAEALSVADLNGNAKTLHEYAYSGSNCLKNSGNILWSPDSSKIAAIEQCSYSTRDQSLVISNVNAAGAAATSSASLSGLIAWLGDGTSLIAQGTDGNGYLIDAGTLAKTVFAENVELSGISPNERYLTYYKGVDESSVCFGKGYRDVWAINSLLNLTADLRVVKEKSMVLLKGTAIDRHFEAYALEYAVSTDPDNWNSIAPASEMPVVDDTFAVWVPPYKGTFVVRLTATDKAGNTAVRKKKISWGISTSITNLFKTEEMISPMNADGVKDTVELYYRALEPVHLEFSIRNEQDELVKTIYKDHASIVEDHISWDGHDESGNFVPDGKYVINVFDYKFSVEVDNTPPDVNAALNMITFGPYDMITFKDVHFKADLSGHAYDKNIKIWTVEYGEGENPQEWVQYEQGNEQRAQKDKQGKFVMPVSDVILVRFNDEKIGWLKNKKLRITAEDYAGNASSAVSGMVEEKLVISDMDEGFSHRNGTVEDIDGSFDLASWNPGVHVFIGFETIKYPLASLTLQAKNKFAWIDIPVIEYSASGRIDAFGDTSAAETNTFRARAVDTSGRVFYSNQVTVTNSPKGPSPEACEVLLTLNVDHQKASGCGLISAKASLKAKFESSGCRNKVMFRNIEYYLQDQQEMKLIRAFNIPTEGWGSVDVNTAELASGNYPVKAVLTYTVEGDQAIRSKEVNEVLAVDKLPPVAQITFPALSSKVCAVKIAGVQGDRYRIPVNGVVSDNSDIKKYAVAYGIGDNPAEWQDASITGTKPVDGLIGYWDINDVKDKGSVFSLQLKAEDRGGNLSCVTTWFSADTLVEISSLTTDKSLFLPNADPLVDGLNINYQVNEPASIDVKVFKLIVDPKGDYVLDATPIRTIVSGRQHIGGNGSTAWNGRDSGGIVSDGSFGIAVFATDSCGNTTMRWARVVVDTTPPTAIIAYPGPVGQFADVIIEVRGSAEDLHFNSYLLEAGAGDGSNGWAEISSGTAEVNNGLLGRWKTSGAEGGWTLRLTVNDRAGNTKVVTAAITLIARNSIIKDLVVAPNLFSPNNDGKLETAEIRYEIAEGAEITISVLDGADAVRWSSTSTKPSLGTYQLTYDGKDNAGVKLADGTYTAKLMAALLTNTSVTQTERVTFSIDTKMPVVDMTSPMDRSYLSVSNLSVAGTVSDANMAEYTISYTGGAGSSTIDQGAQSRSGYTFGALNGIAEGDYTLAVKAKDLAENEVNKNIVFTIDRTPPSVKLDTPKDGEYYGSLSAVTSQLSATIRITGGIVEKNLEVFNLRYGPGDNPAQWTDIITGATVTAYPSPYDWKVGKNDGVPDGLYTLSLYAKDKAGLTGEARAKIVVDNTPPTVLITAPQEGGYVKSALEVKGTAFDTNLDRYTVEMSEGRCATAFKWATIKSATTPVQDGTLANWQALPPDGECCLKVTVIDKVGSSSEAKVNVKVDTRPPTAPILSVSKEDKINTKLAWSGNTEPDLAGFNVYRAGQKINTDLLSGFEHWEHGLAEGNYEYTVTALDFAGNTSGPSNAVKIRIDLTGPDARIRSLQDGARVSEVHDLKGTAFSADDFKQYHLFVGTGQSPTVWILLASSTTPVPYGTLAQWDTLALSEGVYSLKLEAEDTSGNVSVHRVWVSVDNTAPAAPVLLSAAPTNSDVVAAWQANQEPDLAGYLLYRNGHLANSAGVVVGSLDSYLIAGSTYSDRLLPDGTYTYYLVAMDLAGNASDKSNELSVTIDTRAPSMTIVQPSDGMKTDSSIAIKAESPDLDIASVQFMFKRAQDSAWLNLGSPMTKQPYTQNLDPVALGLSYGEYQLAAVGTDKGGRTDAAPQYITVTYGDLSAPLGVTQPYTPTGQQSIQVRGSNAAAYSTIELFAQTVAGYVSRGTTTADAAGTFEAPVTLVPGENKIFARATDNARNISKDSGIVVVVYNDPPGAPTGFSAAVQDRDVHLAWNQNPETDILGYNLYRDSEKVNASDTVAPVEVFASSSFDLYTHRPWASMDNDQDTYWMPQYGASLTNPAWLEIDLAAPELINHLEIHWGADGNALGSQVLYAGKDFEVQVWSGYAWINQVKLTGNTLKDTSFDFKPSYRTDKIRIYITDSTDLNSAKQVRIAGIGFMRDNLVVPPPGISPTYDDLNLPDKKFSYTVTAVDEYGFESSFSEPLTAIVGDIVPPSAPQGLTATADGSSAVLSWAANTDDAAGYAVYRNTSQGWMKISPGAVLYPVFTDPNLSNGTYTYRITAVDNVGNESSPSNEVSALISVAPPQAPVITAVEAPAEGMMLSISWQYAGGSSAGYRIYRGANAGGPYEKVNMNLIGTLSFVDRGLLSGIPYYYVVVAVDAAGNEGANSNEVSGIPAVSPAPGKPIIFYPAMPGTQATVNVGSANLIGSAATGAEISLYHDGAQAGKTTALENDAVRSLGLVDYPGDWPALSPDGNSLAYYYEGALRVRLLTTGESFIVMNDAYNPVWSPDGSKIAYTQDNYSNMNWMYRIGIYDVKTGEAASLTSDEITYEYNPSWSADSKTISFAKPDGEAPGIWMKNISTGNVAQAVIGNGIYYQKMSPDGNKIAYIASNRLSLYDLVNGGTQIVDDFLYSNTFEWSPDGKKLAFVSYRNGAGEVDILNMDTGNQTLVIGSNADPYYLAWAADSRNVLYSIWDNANERDTVWIGDAQGQRHPRQIKPDLKYVYAIGVSRSGVIAVVEENDSGVYAAHLVTPEGRFGFDAILLRPGENIFTATASDAKGSISDSSDSVSIMWDAAQYPDLSITVEDVYLYPPYPITGERMSVNAAVRNNGQTAASNVDVSIYAWNSLGALEVLKSERIASLDPASSALITAEWDSTGKTGANRLIAVVDPYDTIAEADETNNMAIKDFRVADHEGIALTAALDAAEYGSDKNVVVTVTARNSGQGKNAVLETRIEDGNGYPVAIFAPRNVVMNYASESVQTYFWNTGATFAATYSVRTLLKEGTTVLAESTVPFVILPDRMTTTTLVTDKADYDANEAVAIVATIGNESKNWIIPSLRSKLTVNDADGGVLLSEEKTFVNLLPGSKLSHTASWNTGLNAVGNYAATLEVTTEGTATTAKSTAFTIREAAVVDGTLTVVPDAVSFGGLFQAAYTLANSGNADTGPFLAQIAVIDPDTLTVMDVYEEQIAVVRGVSIAKQAVFSTAKYGLKKYTVLLKKAEGNVTRVLASASMTVKDMTSPTMTVLSPVAGIPNTTTVSFLVAASDDASGVDRIEYRRDGGSWSLLPVVDPSRGRFGTTWDPTMADNGMHTVSFRAVDRAGNQSEETMITYEVKINRAPTAPSPAWPADGQDVGTVRPEIAVNNASDPNGDGLSYVFELYADSDLKIIIALQGVVPEGTGMTTWTVPADLTENAVYYWRAQAFDGKLYGPWTDTASFRVNAVEDPPSAPIPTSPADKTEVATLTPVLTVINAVDPDSTSLTYNFQVALDPTFVTIVTSTEGVIGGVGSTSWQVPVPLAEDVRYYWRSQADDWKVTGNWSSPVEFIVNTGNNRPSDPSVITPANGSQVMTMSPDIVLQNSIDPDSPVITYTIELDTVRTFNSPNLLRVIGLPQGQVTTMWHVDGLLENTGYFVHAKASDGVAESYWSNVNEFFVNTLNDAPSIPVPANPSNGAGVDVFTPTLSVQNATDIDRDALTYEFEVYEDAALTPPAIASVAGVVEAQGSTSWTVSATLQENRTYYWRAQAFDGVLASGWTTSLSFTVNTGDDPPSAPMIISPADGGSVDTAMPTLTVLNAIDPDSTRLTYEFQVFYGSVLIWTAPGIAEGTDGSTSATLNIALNDNTVYSWRCRANDGQLDGVWTDMTSFTIHLPQTGIKVDIEVEPETLNQKSKGNWVMVEIELPHGYKAEDVDISSIRLEGTVPSVMWPHERKKHHHDHGCDDDHREHEHGELKVKFRRSDVIAVLPAGEHVPVHITGTVAGTPFEGVDIIKVFNH